MRSVLAFASRLLRAVKLLARDHRIPRPLRWLAGFGLLPIPGPVDEVILVSIAPVFAIFYRQPMRDAWHAAGSGSPPEPDALNG